jgi:hypothetical protein
MSFPRIPSGRGKGGSRALKKALLFGILLIIFAVVANYLGMEARIIAIESRILVMALLVGSVIGFVLGKLA